MGHLPIESKLGALTRKVEATLSAERFLTVKTPRMWSGFGKARQHLGARKFVLRGT